MSVDNNANCTHDWTDKLTAVYVCKSCGVCSACSSGVNELQCRLVAARADVNLNLSEIGRLTHVVESGDLTIAQLQKRVEELESLLETSITGLEWHIDAHPEDSSNCDDEHLAACRKALLPPQEDEL